MLKDNDIEKVETIICFPFNKKELLTTLFNNGNYSQQAINNGQEIFKDLLQLVVANDKLISQDDKEESYQDFLNRFSKNTYWVNQLQKLGLSVYGIPENESANFIYSLLDVMSKDVAHNQHKLLTAFKKLIYYDHSLSNPLFMNHYELDWDYLANSNFGKNLTLEITCPRFITYYHQNLSELYSYLYYSYIDLFDHFNDDNETLKDVWTSVDLNNNPIKEFSKICTDHNFNVGTFFLRDQYYWYCINFVGKFKYCFAAKSEKKEDAKNASIMKFLQYYHQSNRKAPDLKIHDNKELSALLINVQSKLDLQSNDEDELKQIYWPSTKATTLIHELNKHDFFTLSIFYYEKNHSNCTICLNHCTQAFSANGSGETIAQANASQLLINYCHDFNK